MAVSVRCSKCNKQSLVEPKHIGTRVRCSQCGTVFVANVTATEPAPSQTGGFWAGLKGAVGSLMNPATKAQQEPEELSIEMDGPAVATEPAPPAVKNVQGQQLDIAGATSTGKVRSRNEDSFAVQQIQWACLEQHRAMALIVVADGMGGYGAGDRASALIVQQILGGFAESFGRGPTLNVTQADTAEAIARLIRTANMAVLQKGIADSSCHGMGATLAVVLINGADVSIGHVGDCRVYHYAGGKLTQVTRDHTLVARMVELGQLTPVEARTHPRRNEVTQAVGKQPEIQPAAYQLRLGAGDWLVIASDGLHAHVDDAALAAALATAPPSAGKLAEHLVDLANQGGGTDNCTVVAVRQLEK